MNQPDAEDTRDASWVIVDTPLPLPALREFCADVERLWRINPCLEFGVWRRTGSAAHHAEFSNLSNQQRVVLDMRVERESDDAFTLVYSQGVKASTRFLLAASAGGSRLTITDDYSRLSDAERGARLHEVDKSLDAWGWALHAYLRRHQRWQHFAPWRWFMRRCWLPLTPRARRIGFMLVVITAAELALVLMVALVYWLESR